MKKTYVFVYGTLKKGYCNDHYLTDAKFISNAVTYERYQMHPVIGNGYPFLIKSEKVNFIKGEVYEVNSQEILDNLDMLEAYPFLYLKEFIKVELENEEIIQALTYFKNEETNKDSVDRSKSLIEW